MKNIALEDQMELTLGSGAQRKAAKRKASPRRAGWWFGQMRRAVDRALDWKPRPAAPAHQDYFALESNPQNW